MGRAERKPMAPHVSPTVTGHREFMLDPAIDRARRMHARVLASWAMDCLCLRRDGLCVPGARHGTGELGSRSYRGTAPVGATRARDRVVPRWTPARKHAA